MLFREKILVSVLVFFAVCFYVDQTTPWGNKLWEDFTSNRARYAVVQNNKTGYINARGKLIVPYNYDEGVNYSFNEPFPVRKDDRWGFINHENQVIVPFKYVKAYPFEQGLAVVSSEEFNKNSFIYGYVNKEGKEILPLIYEDAKNFTEKGIAAVKKSGKWGFINIYGDMIIPSSFDDVQGFYEGLAAIKVKDKWGYIDYGGQIVIDAIYEQAGDFSQGVAAVKYNGKWGYINTKAFWVIDPVYIQASDVSKDGLALVKNEVNIGFVNQDGIEKFSSDLWVDAANFSEERAAVKVKKVNGFEISKWGFIDKRGNFIIQPSYDEVTSFKGGLAKVVIDKQSNHIGYINKKGQLVWDPSDWRYTNCVNEWINFAINGGIIIYIYYLIRYFVWRIRINNENNKKTVSDEKPSQSTS